MSARETPPGWLGIDAVLRRVRVPALPGPLSLYAWGAVFFGAVLLGTVPWQPHAIDFTNLDRLRIDLSAVLVLDELFTRGSAFGVDAVHVYGPLSFLRTAYYYPGTFGYLVAGRAVLAIAQAGALWHLAHARLERGKVPALIAAACTLTWLAFLSSDPLLSISFVLLNLSYFLGDRDRPSAATLCLAFAAGMLALVKFQFFALLLAQLAVITAADLFSRRRYPWVPTVALASLLFWWLAVGQGLGNLVPWLVTSASLSSSFDETLALGYLEDGRVLQICLFAASIAVLILTHMWGMLETFRGRLEYWLSLLGFAVFLFVQYKYGVVRHDAHAAHAAPAFIAAAALYLLVLPYPRLRLGYCWLYAAGLAAVMAFNLAVMRQWSHPMPLPSIVASKLEAAVRLLPALRGRQGEWRDDFRRRAEQASSHLGFPSLEGSVDVYPDNPAVALLAGLDYRPRPVFLSQSATSEMALRLNAEFLRGAAAPAHVLMEIASCDSRLPTSDDGPSWPELLARYDLVGQPAGFVLLERRSTARAISATPFLETDMAWGEVTSIDDPGPRFVWAQVDIRPSLIGRALALLFKAPIVQIRLRGGDGRDAVFRLLPAAGRAGFILSPRVETQRDLRALLNGARDVQSVRAFSFELAPNLAVMYQRRVDVRLSWLDLDPALSDAPSSPEDERLESLQALFREAGEDFRPPFGLFEVDPETRREILYAHAPSAISLPISAEARRLRLGFGMRRTAYDAPERGDGATFVISGVLPGGERSVLFERHLDPTHSVRDQGEQTATVSFPPGTYRALIFQTLPGPRGDPRWDHSYWSLAKVE